MIGLIEDRGYTVIRLAAKLEEAISDQEDSLDHSGWLGISQIEDATETKLKLCSESVDWMVVDHYALDCNWEGQLNPICKKMIVIDDLADRKHLCDLLIDQTLGRQNKDYKDLKMSSRKCPGAMVQRNFIAIIWRENFSVPAEKIEIMTEKFL